MKRVPKGIALTVLSAVLAFNAACADSFVAYGADFGMTPGSATVLQDNTYQEIEEKEEESGADASDPGVPIAEDEGAAGGAASEGSSEENEKAEDESASAEDSTNEDISDVASSEDSINEDISDAASSEDSINEDASDAASSEISEEAPVEEENKRPVGAADNQIGDNVFYTYSNGVLTLKGSGSTYDYDGSLANGNPFSALKGIKSIVVENGVTRLGNWLLSRVGDNNGNFGTSLTRISLPSSLTEIGEKTFSGIYATDVNITIPSSVTFVGAGGLGGFFKDVNFAEGTKQIFPYAMQGAIITGKLNLPSTLERIGEHGFDFLMAHNDLTLPASLKYIDPYAFYCYEGRYVYFTGDIPQIGDHAFEKTSSMGFSEHSYYIIAYYPKDNKTWTEEKLASFRKRFAEIDFRSLGGTRSDKCGEKITWSYNSSTEILTIKGSGPMYNYSANNRAPWTEHRRYVKEVRFEGNITTIGNFSFYQMNYIHGQMKVNLPSTIERIGDFAFYETILDQMKIPAKVTYFGDYCFYYNGAMVTDTSAFNSETTYIGKYAFCDCGKLQMKLPKFTKITKIGDSAFRACILLTGTLEFPDTLTYIGDNAFSACRSLSGKLRLPKNLTYIGESAFRSKNIYGDIEIPSGVTQIGMYTFAETQITSVSMSDRVTSIGQNAFIDCAKLSSVKLSSSITAIDYNVFNGCKLLTEIEIPASVTRLYMSAFGNTGLKKMVFKGDRPTTLSSLPSGQSVAGNIEVHYPRAKSGWYLLTDEQKAAKLGLASFAPKFVPYGDPQKCRVTFVRKDDPSVTLAVLEVEGGKTIDLSKVNLKLEGLDIYGYYWDDPRSSVQQKFDFTTRMTKDMTIYVGYDVGTCTVSYDPQNGNPIQTYRYRYGDKAYVGLPSPQKWEGHYFVGWSRTPVEAGKGGTRIDRSTEIEIKSDITFYAIWLNTDSIIINYDTCREDYHTVEPDKIQASERAVVPHLWDLYGGFSYEFCGWYYDRAYTKKAEEGDPLSVPQITLYAKWNRLVHKVHYDVSDADNLKDFTVEVPYGEILKEPDVKPSKAGFKFYGWCKEGTYELYEFREFSLAEDLNLYAVFIDPVENEDYGNVPEYIRKESGYYFAELMPKLGWVYGGGDQTYTGKAIVPSDIEVFYYKKILKEGTDYTYKLKNNVKAGKAKVIVTFKGGYSGTIEGSFTIKPLDLFSAKFRKQLELGAQDVYLSYNGKVQKAKNTVKVSLGGKMVTLKEGRDFVYEYPSADDALKAPGTYTVKIVGKNNYGGSISFKQHITELVPMSKVKVTGVKNLVYSGKPLTQTGLIVKYGSKTLTEGVDFETDYQGTNTEIGTATLTLKAKDGSDYIGNKTVTFKITGTPLSKMTIVGFKASVPYDDGREISQDVKIYTSSKAAKAEDSNELLKEGTDYTITYEGNRKLTGKVTTVFTGKGKYSGVVRKTFRIAPAVITEDDIAIVVNSGTGTNISMTKGQTARVVVVVAPSYYYSVSGSKPYPAVFAKNSKGQYSTIYSSSDYTLSYGKNNKVGEKTGLVKITLNGNKYKGTVTYSFDITKADFSKYYVYAPDVKFRNVKGNCKTTLQVMNYGGKKLVNGRDYSYELQYANGSPVDVKKDIVPENTLITAVISPKGNFEFKDGRKSLKYTYRVYGSDRDIANADIVIGDIYFKGKAVEIEDPSLIAKATLNGKALKLYDDEKGGDFYAFSYKNNGKAGTATVTFEGCGEYSGRKTVKFKILRKNLEK